MCLSYSLTTEKTDASCHRARKKPSGKPDGFWCGNRTDQMLQTFFAYSATATAGFFQGVDIPGRTLSLVVIDRIPFPRPDDPLLSARRELLGAAAFGQIDLPRAAMLLAQATGRLIRTSTDRGVVAVMDPRLGKANYRWDIVKALPPMKRTRERAEAEAFLREITS